MESGVDSKAKVRELETMVVFALFFLFLSVTLHRQHLIYPAMGFLFVALFVPPLARIITLGWGKFSLFLGHVNSRIILTVIFYLVLTPLAYLYRLFHKDPLMLAPKETASYFCERNHTYTSADLEKMW